MRKHVTALILILVSALTVTAVFTPKVAAKVVIHEFPVDRDYVVVYSKNLTKNDVVDVFRSAGLPVKSVEVTRKDGYEVFTIHTSIGKKTGIFSRSLDGKILAKLSRLGEVYIYINRGCTVKGDVRLVKRGDIQNLYRVTGYGNLTYEVQGSVLAELLAVFLAVPASSFLFSRYYARKVFSSDLSREEKLYRIRRLAVFISIPIALVLVFSMILLNTITVYDMVVSYFTEYSATVFVIGFLGIWMLIYAVSVISATIGFLPYYRALKREKIESGKAAKHTVLVITMFVLPAIVWVIVMLNLPENLSSPGFVVALLAVFVLAFMSLSPNLVTLFHRAESLKTPLRDEIIEFCEKNGVRISDVKVLRNLPERSVNAGVSGILHRYVFLTDHLIESFSREEILAVVAHEIGHVKEKHSLILGIYTIAFFAVWIYVSNLINPFSLSFYAYAAILLAVMSVFFLTFGRIAVYLEHRADRFAAKTVGRDLYARVLTKLAEINVMKRKTGKLFSIFTLHPSIEERIEKL